MELNNLFIRPATYEQWLRTHEDQLPHWGQGLTLEQFSAKEHRLCLETDFGSQNFHRWYGAFRRSHRLGERRSRAVHRVLVPKNDPDTLEYASSCKSYARPIYVQSSDGKSKEAVCHSVAGVCMLSPSARSEKRAKVCLRKNRNKGYAKHMMSLLHEQFRKDGILSVLYSDVGDFYSKAKQVFPDGRTLDGWQIISPFEVNWSVSQTLAASPNVVLRRVEEEDLHAVCTTDALLLKEEVESAKGPTFAILPTTAQILWMKERCKFFDNLRFPAAREQYPHFDNWGCQMGEIGRPDWAFALWSYDSAKSRLIILRLRCTTQEQLRALIGTAQRAGEEQGMKEVTAWNLDEELAEACGWRNKERRSSLPAMAWYGEGDAPKRWLANEHWAWC